MPDVDPYDPNQNHHDPAVQELIRNGWLGEWDYPVSVSDLENGVAQVRQADASEIVRLRTQVQAMRTFADKLAAESPMPGPGGFIAKEIHDRLDAAS